MLGVTADRGRRTATSERSSTSESRTASSDGTVRPRAPRPEEWCLIEWPADEPEPTKYFLSTLPPNISRPALVNATKLRRRIERDYQDLKQELGLGHYEGRGWRGFHHHATLSIAAIRIPDLRTGSDSPLRTKRRHSRRRTSPSRRLSTPRIPRSDLNVTSQPRSPLSAPSSPALSHASSRAAPVASASHADRTYDTVRLNGRLSGERGLIRGELWKY
jgi:hypothetical protein